MVDLAFFHARDIQGHDQTRSASTPDLPPQFFAYDDGSFALAGFELNNVLLAVVPVVPLVIKWLRLNVAGRITGKHCGPVKGANLRLVDLNCLQQFGPIPRVLHFLELLGP
jgi:hypothetical protein